MELIYKNYLDALETALKACEVSPRVYTILGVRDESICLTYSEGMWQVFYMERGKKRDLIVHEDIQDACMAVIHAVSETDDDEARLQRIFRSSLKEGNTAVTGKAVNTVGMDSTTS